MEQALCGGYPFLRVELAWAATRGRYICSHRYKKS
jgi:hypothetical protein